LIYDARGQIILTCRCILESEGNEGSFAEPFVSAVHGVCSKKEFADRGLEVVETFDQIRLTEIIEVMRSLEYFQKSDVSSVLGQIVRNKVRRILAGERVDGAEIIRARAAIVPARATEAPGKRLDRLGK
jgi:hypothetical protein